MATAPPRRRAVSMALVLLWGREERAAPVLQRRRAAAMKDVVVRIGGSHARNHEARGGDRQPGGGGRVSGGWRSCEMAVEEALRLREAGTAAEKVWRATVGPAQEADMLGTVLPWADRALHDLHHLHDTDTAQSLLLLFVVILSCAHVPLVL
ncbi:hypothetical protein ACQ4PT_060136 [Festuca glaucescens]